MIAAWTLFNVIVKTRLGVSLSNHVDERRLGTVLAFHVDVQLSPHDSLEPDLCFVSNERAEIIGDRLLDGAPDLVIEVLSPSTRRYDLVAKRAMYATHGVREYWIVDPESKTIRVFMFEPGQTLELAQTGERVRSIVFPDLDLRPDNAFR